METQEAPRPTLQQIEAAKLQEKLRHAAHFTPLVEALEAVLCARFIEEQIQLGHTERHDHTMTMDDALDQARAALDATRE